MRLSYKDFLLLIGILVAVIIVFTTLVYRDHTGDNKQTGKKSSMNSSTSMVFKKLIKAPSIVLSL